MLHEDCLTGMMTYQCLRTSSVIIHKKWDDIKMYSSVALSEATCHSFYIYICNYYIRHLTILSCNS